MIRARLRRTIVISIAATLMLTTYGGSLGSTALAQTASVSIASFKFTPAVLTVQVGTTVTWTNSDAAPHTATSDTSDWATPRISTGQSASVTFTHAGTFAYHCSVHPSMKATIVVQDAAASSAPTVKVAAKEVNNKYVFGPAKTKIKVGQTVVWKNTTDAIHTVTSTTKGWVFDKKLRVGASLRHTFAKAGTFHYKCSFHPGMVGTVIVSK